MKDYKQANTYLSKSLFMRGLQCHKSLYLFKYHQDLRDKPTEEQEALFSAGHEVGKLAQQLFPGGVEIPYEENNYAGQAERTKAEIEKGTKTIYEATFSFDNIFVKIDILSKGKRGWELYEVKSSTEVKDVYIDDVAIQYYVLSSSGLKVSKASVVYINNEYTRHGNIDVNQLFAVEDITDRVIERLKTIPTEIETLRVALSGDMPVIDIGPQCSDPYECDFAGNCWQHIPENSVFDLRGKGIDKFEYYRNGIVRLADLPLNDLNDNQRMQTEAILEKKDFIDTEGVKEFLDSLSYPIYFLDFETFNDAIPPFDGTRPYQQILFQFSLYWLEHEGAELKHAEYLAAPAIDPREELTEKLLQAIPDDVCVLAYNKAFEIGVLRSLAEWFPKHAVRIGRIIENMQDLAGPFRKKYFYRWQMNGSWSIKSILPALLPEMNYENLGISDGGMAMRAYFTMNETQDPEEIKKIRSDLLEYSKLDTLAMVKILDKLRQLNKTGRQYV